MNRLLWTTALLALAAPLAGCPNETAKECTTAADCPKPSNECYTATCEADKCGTSNVTADKATSKQTAGDCMKVVCDGKGKTKSVVDDTDVNDDANPCTDDACDLGTPTNEPSAAGTDCSASGTGTTCDGSGNCVTATCGNGSVEAGEACDGANLNGKTCLTQGFSAGTLSCNANCSFNTSLCTGANTCGNGFIEAGESCDGTNLNAKTCLTEGFAGGTLACKADCSFDTAACTVPMGCGNGAVDGTEACDGVNLNSKTCLTEGFAAGTLACKANCTLDTSACTAAATCGNGAIDGTEACDGANLNSKTCLTQGFGGGTLSCNANCTFNTAACTTVVLCGNGTLDTGEQCDGTNLNSKTCQTQGFVGGTLSCSSTCTFNTSACTNTLCGNSAIDGTEDCDGTNLNSKTCLTEGFGGGTLSCNANCTFNTGACTAPVNCGNGTIDLNEDCDGTNLNSKTCTTISGGFTGGTLACGANCKFLTTGCTSGAVCGNGTIETGEECEGTNLNNQTCLTQGFTGGTLTCATTLCLLDTTACTGGPTCGVPGNLGTVAPVAAAAQAGTSTNGDYLIAQFNLNADPDRLRLELLEGAGVFASGLATGTYTLAGDELNYATCGLCLLLVDDLGKTYMPTGGTVTLTSITGTLTGTLSNVAFQEVTIDPSTYQSTPVTGGCQSTLTGMAMSVAISLCGDGAVGATEQCDGTNLGTPAATCVSLGFGGGTLACTTTCGFDTSACTVPTAWTCDPTYFGGSDGCDCGCGAVDADCDDATVASCDYDCDSGGCSTMCSQVVPTNNAVCAAPVCGDGAVDAGEDCEGTDVGTATCLTVPGGFTGGTLACNASTCKFDTSGCTGAPVCGNSVIEAGEDCEGGDLNGASCTTLGYTGGTLTCSACKFVTSACTGTPTCGLVANQGTVTPTNALAQSGTASGASYVLSQFDLNADPDRLTMNLYEGAGVFAGGLTTGTYTLSGDELSFATCGLCLVIKDNLGKYYMPASGSVTLSSVSGRLTGSLSNVAFQEVTIDATTYETTPVTGGCQSTLTAMAFDVAMAVCGDGTIGATEECDGTNLGTPAATCSALGFSGGTLACNATTCRFDTTACTVPTGWVCDPTFFAGKDGCDCGCGVVDPDCADATVASCSYNCDSGGCSTACSQVESTNNAVCVAAPVCGDGAITGTEECDGTNLGTPAATCQSVSAAYTGGMLSCDPTTCMFVTTACTGWTCDITYYDDAYDICDCGCGVPDPDCANATAGICEYCDNAGSCSTAVGCPGTIDPTNNAVCVAAPVCGDGAITGTEECDGTNLGTPAATCQTISAGYTGGTLSCDPTTCMFVTTACTGWTCDIAYYDDTSDICDCGCGVLDPDCADATVGSCFYCDNSGSCSSSYTCDDINPTNNAVCVAGPVCGDGNIDTSSGEECDGTNLGTPAATCLTVPGGFTGGTLACNATTCKFDTSACTTATRQDIVLFTFEGLTNLNTAGPIVPQTGTGSLVGNHTNTSTYSGPAGNGSILAYNSTYWVVGDNYQVQTVGTGATDLQISWDQTRSGTGPTTFQVQWSVDGTTYTDVGATVTVPQVTWNTITPSTTSSFGPVTLPAGANNAAALYVRITATIAGTSTGGTSRVDNVRVTGLK